MDSKNGAARRFFDPSYFVTALVKSLQKEQNSTNLLLMTPNQPE
jgi:hypothetical protein